MRGLPHTYRNVEAETGSFIQITINGEAGGEWYLVKKTKGWLIDNISPSNTPDAFVTIQPDIAWKLFTKAITASQAIENSVIKGDIELAKNMFSLIAVMA